MCFCVCSAPVAKPAAAKGVDTMQKLLEAKAAARREIGVSRSSSKELPGAVAAANAASVTAAPKEFKTLDVYYRDRETAAAAAPAVAAPAAPAANAWSARPPVPTPVVGAAGRKPSPVAAAAAGPLRPVVAATLVGAAAAGAAGTSRPTAAAAAAAASQQPLQSRSSLDLLHRSSSLAAQSSSSSLGLGLAGDKGGAGSSGALVGAEYIGEDDEKGLTKAQRKNLKRAEKKKRQQVMETTSITSSDAGGGLGGSVAGGGGGPGGPQAGPGSSADADELSVMEDLAIQGLIAHKTLCAVRALQRLGFPDWQCVAGVRRHGAQLQPAIAWLLEGGAPTPEAARAATLSCVPEVDVGEEMRQLEQLVEAVGDRGRVMGVLVDTGGDLDQVRVSLLGEQEVRQQQQQVCSSSTGNGDVLPLYQQLQNQEHFPELGTAAAAAARGGAGAASSSSNSIAAMNGPSSSSGGGGGAASAAAGLWSGGVNGHLPNHLQQEQEKPCENGSSSSGGGIPPGPNRGSLDGFPGLPSSSGNGRNEQQQQRQLLGASTSGREGVGSDSSGKLWQPGGEASTSRLGGYGLGQSLLQQQQQQQGGGLLHQESLSSKDPVLESFGSDTTGGTSLLRATTGNLQQSRLMNCYGWQPLFNDSGTQQQSSVLQQLQQQHHQQHLGLGGVSSSPFLGAQHGGVSTTANLDLSGQENKTSSQEDETDLEGLMATLMCH